MGHALETATVATIAGLFTASSIAHGLFNDIYTRQRIGSVRLLAIHYALLGAFLLITVIYAFPVLARILPALALVGLFWLVVHGVRVTLDLTDGVGSRTRSHLIRHLADAVANMVTVAFVLAVATRGDTVLLWPAFALAAGMVGKEFVFRTYGDMVKRGAAPRKTPQGGAGRRSPPPFRTMHAAWNTVKSAFYIAIGFALIFRCLASLHPFYADIVFGGARNVDQFPRALGFTLRNLQLTTSGDPDPLLMALFLAEAACALMLALSVNSVPFRR